MTSPLALDPVFRLVVELPRRVPPATPRRLAGLFRELARPEPDPTADAIEDLIWALWIAHEEPAAQEAMRSAIDGIATGSLKRANALLDHLIEAYPSWAEAWNKRATLAFIERRDCESLADIARTLELEPRHFGAMAGFGQICLRNGHLNEARAAFQIALSLNPHLEDLREVLDDLGPRLLMLH